MGVQVGGIGRKKKKPVSHERKTISGSQNVLPRNEVILWISIELLWRVVKKGH